MKKQLKIRITQSLYFKLIGKMSQNKIDLPLTKFLDKLVDDFLNDKTKISIKTFKKECNLKRDNIRKLGYYLNKNKKQKIKKKMKINFSKSNFNALFNLLIKKWVEKDGF